MGKIDPFKEFATQSSIARNANNDRDTRLEAAYHARRYHQLLNRKGHFDLQRNQIMRIIDNALREQT